MRTLSYLMPVAVLAMFVLSMETRAADEKVPLDKVPKAVMDTVKAKFPGAEIIGAALEKNEQGKPEYEVEIKVKGQHIDVSLTPEGKITVIEKTIDAKDAPKPVAKAVEDKYPKSTIKRVEEIIKDDKLAYYEYLLETADKKSVEVEVDPQGKILKEEKK